MEEEETERGRVISLIEKATNSTAAEVDPRLLKAIKLMVRSSDWELRFAAQTLMDLMKREHSQVRFLALLIIDELFMRSKLFRALMTENLDLLLSLSIGFRRNQPLPAPPAVASALRSKAIEFLEKWNATFGTHYRQLRLGFDYLKNTLRFEFPNLQANAVWIQQQRREREMRTREILQNKFEMLRENLSSIKDEIQSTIEEIHECLEIVRTEDESSALLVPLDDEEYEENRNPELQQIRLNSLKEGEKVKENSDNKVIFDMLRELYKLLVTKHLVSVQQWISVLIRVEVDETRFRDATLKDFIDIRNNVQATKKKCEESGCALPETGGNEEDVIWEEGRIEPVENGGLNMPTEATRELVASSTCDKLSEDTPDCSYKDANSKGKSKKKDGGGDLASLRSKLFAEAPIMQWDSFLDNWGTKRDVLANQRGLELDGHWGRVDYDAVISAEKIAELNVQATVYKEKHVEIQPCHAPLSNGKLCQRRDLRVCPFHGPIVPRDDAGNPIYPQDDGRKPTTSQNEEAAKPRPLTRERSPDLRDTGVEHLANQAIKNVRERDKEAAKAREKGERLLKRAKLAKVREHNQAVLREAALASTSGSVAAIEYIDAANEQGATMNKKKPTLASMLRPKVTAKDRLGQRLLSTRARDATVRQLTMGEDMKYRESFPNQW
ncbi:hypothetical protein Ancab_036778 [Ancistrocladus abbreviatus]